MPQPDEEHRKISEDLFYPGRTCLRTGKSKHNHSPHWALKPMPFHLIPAKALRDFHGRCYFPILQMIKLKTRKWKEMCASLVCRCLSVSGKCVSWLKGL